MSICFFHYFTREACQFVYAQWLVFVRDLFFCNRVSCMLVCLFLVGDVSCLGTVL